MHSKICLTGCENICRQHTEEYNDTTAWQQTPQWLLITDSSMCWIKPWCKWCTLHIASGTTDSRGHKNYTKI